MTHGDPDCRSEAVLRARLCDFAGVSPVVDFAAEFASPLNDPEKPFEHICYTVPWNMAGESRRLDQMASFSGPDGYDRRPDHRPPF